MTFIVNFESWWLRNGKSWSTFKLYLIDLIEMTCVKKISTKLQVQVISFFILVHVNYVWKILRSLFCYWFQNCLSICKFQLSLQTKIRPGVSVLYDCDLPPLPKTGLGALSSTTLVFIVLYCPGPGTLFS